MCIVLIIVYQKRQIMNSLKRNLHTYRHLSPSLCPIQDKDKSLNRWYPTICALRQDGTLFKWARYDELLGMVGLKTIDHAQIPPT